MKKAKSKTKPKLSARERILLLILPAALVVLLYSFGWNPSHIKALTSSTGELQKAREKESTRSVVLDDRSLDREIARLSAEKTKLQRQLDALTGEGSTDAQRTETVMLMSALLRRHRLLVVEESPVGAPDKTVAPRTTAKKSALSGKAPERFWKIRFLGSWADVTAALTDLRSFEAPCFPVSLTMAEPQSGTPIRDWTLRLRL